jgi:hypothetical protein
MNRPGIIYTICHQGYIVDYFYQNKCIENDSPSILMVQFSETVLCIMHEQIIKPAIIKTL